MEGKNLWESIWLSQGRKCASCGRFVKLENTAKSSYSFKIVCRDCYDKPNAQIVIDEFPSPTTGGIKDKGVRMNKYGARRTYSELCQRTFASKAECIRGEELRILEIAGEICELQYQPKFALCEKPKVTITLDFAYREYWGSEESALHWVYEDVKGVLTRDSRTKMAWLKEQYGIEVKLIR